MPQLVGESLNEFHDFEVIEFAEEAGDQLAEAIEQDYKDQNLNEAVAMLALSTILAAPAFVNILGMLIKKGAKAFKWKGGEDGGKALQAFAHKAEHKLQQPLNWVLKKLGVKDEEKRSKWTKGIFALIIILLGVYSGVEAYQAYKAANISKTAAEGLLTGLKASETGETLFAAIKTAGSTAAKTALATQGATS